MKSGHTCRGNNRENSALNVKGKLTKIFLIKLTVIIENRWTYLHFSPEKPDNCSKYKENIGKQVIEERNIALKIIFNICF